MSHVTGSVLNQKEKNDQCVADAVIGAVRQIFGYGAVPLHRPVFGAADKAAVTACIDGNFVSSVGPRVDEFEEAISRYTGAAHAVAMTSGTAALHIALLVGGIKPGDEVITQPLTFIAACNAIRYVGAWPLFIDNESTTLGLCPRALEWYLLQNAQRRGKALFNKRTGRRITACLPMHTFGLPSQIEEIICVCEQFGVQVIEDAAEGLGSRVADRHVGTFGRMGVISFNGNKVITTGGGGMLLTNDALLARRARHLSTTARAPHAYTIEHDELGYNYRMPALNAALGLAQMARLPRILEIKRQVALRYKRLLAPHGISTLQEQKQTCANYWLNAIIAQSREQRDRILEATNKAGIMTRPAWQLMHRSKPHAMSVRGSLDTAEWLQERLINLPSSVPANVTKVTNESVHVN